MNNPEQSEMPLGSVVTWSTNGSVDDKQEMSVVSVVPWRKNGPEEKKEPLGMLALQKLILYEKFGRTKVGRNEPCPCGSQRKYKKCCLAQYERSYKELQEREENNGPKTTQKTVL